MAKADGAVQSESFSGITGLISLKSSNSENGWFTRWSGFFTKYINDSQKLSVFDNKIILSIEISI